MKKKVIAALIVGLVIIMSTTLTGCSEISPQERIKIICNVEIPEDATIVYDFYNSFPQGDFTQYTVFSFTEEPSEFLNSNGYTECVCELNHQQSGLHWPSKDEEHFPNFEESHLFAKFEPTKTYPNVTAVTFYFPDTKKIVLLMYN